MNEFWISNPEILYKDYWSIIPKQNMTRVEQMNAISRFIIYLIIILILFGFNNDLIIYCLIILVLIIIFNFIYENNEKNVINDIVQKNKSENEEFYNQQKFENDLLNNADYNPSINSIYDNYKENFSKTNNDDIDYQSGYINFDDEYQLGSNNSNINIEKYNDKLKKQYQNKIPYTKNKIYEKNTCKKPTVKNPFMNIVFSDYLDLENVPQACNTSDENIQKEMNNLYNSSIYRNMSDVFSRHNSQNMFYTVPTNLGVQGQTDFRNWLYKTNETCKENTANCTYPERLYGQSQRY